MTAATRLSFALARPLLGGVLAATALLLAGCASPTPYAPRLQGEQTGYTDRQLAPNRYRVTFSGNTVTPRETVESYLLLRAAEVTRAAGYDFFVFDTRNTKARTTYQTVPNFPADPWYGPWYGPRFYPHYWGGWGFAYEPSVDVIARTKYDAYAEIVVLTPEQARSEPRAINAAEVIRHLGPDAVPPDRQGRPLPPPPPPPPA
jgi:hypothetical protein